MSSKRSLCCDQAESHQLIKCLRWKHAPQDAASYSSCFSFDCYRPCFTCFGSNSLNRRYTVAGSVWSLFQCSPIFQSQVKIFLINTISHVSIKIINFFPVQKSDMI